MDKLTLKYFYSLEDAEAEWLWLENNAVFYYFQSFLWLSEWHSNIGKKNDSEPFIITVYRKDEPAALFPFCIESKYGIFRFLTWMGGKLADYNAPVFSRLLSEEERRDISVMVAGELCGIKDIDLLFFPRMPEYLDDGSINPMNHTGFLKPCTDPEDYLYAPYIILKDWESIYNGINKRMRNVSSKFRRRLTDMGEVKFRITADPDEVSGLTKVMISQKAKGLSNKAGTNPFEDSDYINFYLNTGVKAQKKGYLHLSRLTLSEQTIAVHWGILFNKRLYWLVPSFDINYRTNGPGRLLLEELIRWCCDNNLRCFDFCLGDEPYKSQWTDTRMLLSRYMKPLTFRGVVFNKLYRTLRPLLKRMKGYTVRPQKISN